MTAHHFSGESKINGYDARVLLEAGVTLIEITIAMTLMSLLMAVVLPLTSSFLRIETDISHSYDNENQLLPVSTSLENLMRTAVSPAPSHTNGQPVPPFGLYTATNRADNLTSAFTSGSLVFYSNTGNVNGPSKVVATLTGTLHEKTFRVVVMKAESSSCPGVSTGSACRYVAGTILITVRDVVLTTILSYYLTSTANKPVAQTKIASTFTTCDAATCNAAEIESIGVDLKVNEGSNQFGQAQDDTVVYQLSVTSQIYDPAVG